MSGPSRFRSLVSAGIFILALSVGAIASKNAVGAPAPETTPRPTAPAIGPSVRKIPETPFRCDRLIRYRGKTLPCDSALRRDGESLHAIVENTPTALEELDKYQDGRNALKFAAYTGTAGIALTLASSLVADLLVSDTNSDGSPADPGRQQRTAKILRWTGASVALGTVIYGLSTLRSNEEHLQQTILKYNAAHPDHPIEILFKTEF